MLLFVAQLIHINCAAVGHGDGEAKQAAFQEIMSSLLPRQTGERKERGKKRKLCRGSEFMPASGSLLVPLICIFMGSDS